MNAEIAWNLHMSEGMRWIEGCYRLEGGPRQVAIAIGKEEVSTVAIRDGLTWASGVTGMNIFLTETACLNATVLLELMSDILGVLEWVEVRGPDSIVLR